MKKKPKEKGLTFLETIAVLVIISVVSLFLFVKISKINEKKDLDMASKTIQEIFFRYSRKSFYKREKYKIDLYLDEKVISVSSIRHSDKEKLELPKKLKYEIIYDQKRNKIFKVETTTNGNLSKAFSIYIFGYGDGLKRKIALYIFQEEKILKINSYINKRIKNINYENIKDYHYSEENKNLEGWDMEEWNEIENFFDIYCSYG